MFRNVDGMQTSRKLGKWQKHFMATNGGSVIPDHVLLDIGSWPLDPGMNTGSVKHDMALPQACVTYTSWSE